MGEDFWLAIAAVAAVAALVPSLLVAKASVSATRIANKTADFANCLKVVESLGEAMRRVRDAKGDSEKSNFEFRELLNLMEALASLINDGNVTPSTLRVAEPFLEEAWAYCHVEPSIRELATSSATSVETFRELMKFAKKRRARIRALIKSFEPRPEVQIDDGEEAKHKSA